MTSTKSNKKYRGDFNINWKLKKKNSNIISFKTLSPIFEQKSCLYINIKWLEKHIKVILLKPAMPNDLKNTLKSISIKTNKVAGQEYLKLQQKSHRCMCCYRLATLLISLLRLSISFLMIHFILSNDLPANSGSFFKTFSHCGFLGTSRLSICSQKYSQTASSCTKL